MHLITDGIGWSRANIILIFSMFDRNFVRSVKAFELSESKMVAEKPQAKDKKEKVCVVRRPRCSFSIRSLSPCTVKQHVDFSLVYLSFTMFLMRVKLLMIQSSVFLL